MEVLTAAEGILHLPVVCNVGQHAQLDLAVVRIHQHPAGPRNEHSADLAAQLRAHGDILQIRLRRGQAAGRRHRVLEGRVDAAVRRDLLLQTVGIGGLELCQHPIIHDRLHHGMLVPQLFQHLYVRRIPALGLFYRREAELAEEQLAKLLRGIDVEFAA